MLDTLKIYLLGQPSIRWQGSPQTLQRRQARALLYYLASHKQPVQRQSLCFLFWPDQPDAKARRNLTRLSSSLRSELPVPQALISQGDHIGLDPNLVWVDYRQFEDHLANEDCQAAADIYRGPFLSGFSLSDCQEFEAWVTRQAQILECQYLDCLGKLVQNMKARADFQAAIQYALRYLQTDELAEEMHRQLIDLYGATGNRSAAIKQFETCTTILERELGVDPLPHTHSTFQAALAGRNLPVNGLAPVHVAGTAESRLGGFPMLGRDEAMTSLESYYQRAVNGETVLVLICGESGIGKTRLVDTFTARLGGKAALVSSQGEPSMQDLPFHLVTAGLRETILARSPKQNLGVDISPIWMAEAARVLPEIHTLWPDIPAPLQTSPEESRLRLFEALRQVLLSLCETGCTPIVWVDDLQWGDPSSLNWLAYLISNPSSQGLMVIGCHQPCDSPSLKNLSHSANRRGSLLALQLDGIQKQHVGQLLQGFKDRLPTNEAFCESLWLHTGGNPYYLSEVLDNLLIAGQSAGSQQIKVTLPETIRSAVQQRLERLGASSRQVLESIAVLGALPGLELIQHTSGRSELETLNGLDELVKQGFIREIQGIYQFKHELTRQVVYSGASHWRRQVLHRRAGEAFEVYQPHDVNSLVWHYEHAGEATKAARYALRACQGFKALHLYQEMLAYLDRVLAGLEDQSLSAENIRLQIQIIEERGWVLRRLEMRQAVEADLLKLEKLVDRLGEDYAIASLRWRQSAAYRWLCCYTESERAAEEALRLAREIGDEELQARCLRELGLIWRAIGKHPQARQALEDALQRYQSLGGRTVRIHILGNLSILAGWVGEHPQAMAFGEQGLALCESLELPLERRVPLGNIGSAAIDLGDYQLAEDSLQESLSIALQIGHRFQEIFCRGQLGRLYTHLNQYDQARQQLSLAIDYSRQAHFCAERSWLHISMAQTWQAMGDIQRARSHANAARLIAARLGQEYHQNIAAGLLKELTAL